MLPLLTLRLSAEPGSPAPGDEVTVTVELRNETPGPVVAPALSSCRFAVWVRAESARPDVLTECPAESEETTLASGAVARRTLRWTPETAGTYGVFAELFAREIQPQIRDSLTVPVRP